MDIFIIAPFAASFFAVLFLLPFWIRKARQIGLVWQDMNKFSSARVAGSGGVIVLLGFMLGTLLLIAYEVFIVGDGKEIIQLVLASLVVVMFLSGIGLVDDLLGWQRGGLSRRSRLILVLLAAVPLVVLNAGKSTIGIPWGGSIDIGLLYPLVLVPLGIAATTTTFNFLAGFNGLEAGQGIILLGGLSLVAFATGHTMLAAIGLCMIAALLAFLFYNFFPAQIFPGDSLTYAVGGLIAIIPIFGNFEKIAIFFFIPYIVEVILKLRGGLVKHSFGKPNKDGTLSLRYDSFYSVNHIAIWTLNKAGIGATEKRVVYMVWMFQLLIIILGLIIFRQGIFGV